MIKWIRKWIDIMTSTIPCAWCHKEYDFHTLGPHLERCKVRKREKIKGAKQWKQN